MSYIFVVNKTGEHIEDSEILLDELWVGFEDFPNYEVSNYGRVVNIRTGRDLRPSVDFNGFHHVALYHKGLRTDVMVHRLVAKAFFLNYQDGLEVKHINEDRNENTVLNLTLTGEPVRKGARSWR